MAERNAQFLQIGLGHIGQDFEIDGIHGKGGRVLGEPNPIKPGFYLVIDAHCRVRPPKVLFIFPLSSLHILLCARAASGHAAAAPPPSRMTKSRRRIPDTRASPLAVGPPHPQPTTNPVAGPWGGPEMF